MKLHVSLCKLYNDERLNKLKWYNFINEKRSKSLLINEIKKKYGERTIMIIGDWGMSKNNIKSISTPNKKYLKLLCKNFPTLKLNEFRTSIIDNKTEIKCENLKSKLDYKKLNIKSVNKLEKVKKKNKELYDEKMKSKKIHKILTCKTSKKFNKYINRDKNAVKNMLKIVSSYIKTNIKPKTYVFGTKICFKHSFSTYKNKMFYFYL
jgi:hypothetical protein